MPKAQERSAENTRPRRGEGQASPGDAASSDPHAQAPELPNTGHPITLLHIFTKKHRTLKHEQKIFKDYTKQERSKFEKEMTRTSRNEKNIIIKMKMKTY